MVKSLPARASVTRFEVFYGLVEEFFLDICLDYDYSGNMRIDYLKRMGKRCCLGRQTKNQKSYFKTNG